MRSEGGGVGHQVTVKDDWGQWPSGPLGIHVAGGQRARQRCARESMREDVLQWNLVSC